MSDPFFAPAESTSEPQTGRFDPAEAILQARSFLALQAEITGSTRYRGPEAPTPPLDRSEPAPPPRAGGSDETTATTVETPRRGASTPATEATSRDPEPAPDSPTATASPAAEPPAPPTDAIQPTDPDVPDLFGAKPDPTQDPTLSPYERVEHLIPEDHPLRDMTSLDEIRDWLAQTVLVPIDESRINPVLGVGPEDADLMVIGEAPGADEDKNGEPFVGRAGQLLNKILDAILLDRDEIYITNILKSRPPNNRDPLGAEVEAHIPILYKQIALVRPKMILAVGKSAGNGLLGKKSSLASLRGKFHDYYGIPLMVTYHPAALLRNPQWKRPTWEDVKLLRTRYDEIGGRARRSA